MRVLLISPLPGIDPPCGDVTYTQLLLANPPDGIVYETYAEALDRGALREHGRRESLKSAIRARRNILRESLLLGLGKSMAFVRRHAWLFWEPFRFFSVRPGEYDAIHLHVFSARFLNLSCPLIVSNAAPLRYLYSEARGYSAQRVTWMERAEVGLARLMGVNANSYFLPQATRLITFTEFLKRWYLDRGVISVDQIDVIPIFLPSGTQISTPERPSRIGFIAKDFAAKGGYTLLNAFELVRRARPDAELVIVGCPAVLSAKECQTRKICWIPYIERDELLGEILPQFHMLAYPTRFDGLPLVVLEAMSRGLPVTISDYQAMPEMVAFGWAGLISPVGDAEMLAENILRLLDPVQHAHYGQAALDWFERTFSETAVKRRLGECYELAIERHGGRAPLIASCAVETVL